MKDPAEVALTDQAKAAERNARESLARSGAAHGITPEGGEVTGGRAAILARLTDRVTSRQITVCPHIDPTRPARQFWLAWSPGDITCGACTKANMPNGPQPCDNCDTSTGHVVVMQLPALVDGERLAALGPTTLMMVLCNECDNTATTTADDSR